MGKKFRKKQVIKSFFVLILVFILNFSLFNDTNKNEYKGVYLGKTPPSLKPEIFDKGEITGDLRLFNISFSPNGNELFFTYNKGTKKKPFPTYEIKHMRRINNIWQKPKTAFFSGVYSDCDVTFSPDGKMLFFSREGYPHPITGKEMDIYYLLKTEDGWSEPIYAGSEVNTKGGEVHGCLSLYGNLFYRSDGKDGYGIYKAEFKNGKFSNARFLGIDGTDCYVDRDERFLLYNDIHKILKKPQIYISFQTSNNQWTKGVSLGKVVNSEEGTMGSIISPDRKYLFYKSRVKKKLAIYWVSTSVIDQLGKQMVKGYRTLKNSNTN